MTAKYFTLIELFFWFVCGFGFGGAVAYLDAARLLNRVTRRMDDSDAR